MSEVVIYVAGALFLVALSFVIGYFMARRYYTQATSQKDAEQYNKLEMENSLNEQTIATQGTQISKLESQHKELQTKFEYGENAVKDLTANKAQNEQKVAGLEETLENIKEEKRQLTLKLETANEKISSLEIANRQQKTELNAETEKIKELKLQFEHQKNELKKEFRVVSEEIIKERQELLNKKNEENIGSMLKPLSEKIDNFQKRVNEVHTDTVKGNTNLEAEIKKVTELGLKMGKDASNLTSALKGSPQQLGAWGEVQLERTLEISGLMKGTHYEVQSTFKDQEGSRKQTDFLINLPGDKHIIIDSKVSLIDYEKAVSATNEDEQKGSMDAHVRAVKKHIDDLSKKDYTNIIGVHSPSFVLMFMPIEPAYIEVLKYDKDLFNYGRRKNIILVSHTTLIPILSTVSNLWILDKSNKEVREVSEKAGDIYNSVCTVAERFSKLGNTLGRASKDYNEVVTAIAGQQGLQGKVERFTQLSSKVSKNMPKIDTQHFDYETSRLNAQPIAIEKSDETLEDNIEE